MMAARESHESEPPMRLTGLDLSIEEYRYRRVELSGVYDTEHQFLLDNQQFQQRAGYHVLTPLKIDGSSKAIMVNRGWVPVGQDRRQLPDLKMAESQVQIGGLLERFPAVGFRLKGAEIPSLNWPSLVQLLDEKQLAQRLGYRLLPYQVLLAANEPDGYQRDWRPVSLNPEKSQGYALQWFSFAAVLLGLYLWFGFRPGENKMGG